VTGRRINSSKGEDGALVEAESARGMPLEYEMMEEPIDEIVDVESAGELRNLDFGWSFQNPACDIQSQVSWTMVKGPRGVMRRTASQTKPRWHCRPSLAPDDKHAPSPTTPSPATNARESLRRVKMENKIQLMGREMECKNNRWDEDRRREGLSIFTVGGWGGIFSGRFLPRDRGKLG
jgi:hypothetical protein